jgi:hypothetical protein
VAVRVQAALGREALVVVRRHREMVRRRERLVEQQRGLCRCGGRIGREEGLQQRLPTMMLLMVVQHPAADGFVRVAVVGEVHRGRRTQQKRALWKVGSQKKERGAWVVRNNKTRSASVP